MFLKLYIEDKLLELFADENVEINSSIATVNDITKNTTDFVRSFTVPASEGNNKIFKHYYDANIDNSFDGRVKVDGKIELDGLPYRTGKWSLEKVIVKKNKPSSYSINFVGNLIALKDKLKNDELSDLDLSAFNHNLDAATVKGYLQNTGDLIYNLLTKKRLYYRSGSENINTNTLANIAFTGGANTGVNWDLLRPSLKLIKIIEAIEAKYNIEFSRDFFGTTEFTSLYLWLNNDALLTNVASNEVRIDFTNIGTIGANGGELDLTDDTFTAGGKSIYGLVRIIPAAGYENVIYSIERRIDGNSSTKYSNRKSANNYYFTIDKATGQKHTFFVSANQEFKFTSTLTIEFHYESYNGVASFPQQTISANFNVSQNMPKIKTIDFLKGLFQMFKLVVTSDYSEKLYIDTIDNYYAKGNIYNITKYVIADEVEVARGELLNEMVFKFQEPKTMLNAQYKKNNGLGYGDTEILLTDDGTPTGKPLDGGSLVVELPFEQIVYERLPDVTDNVLTNIMYGGIYDDKTEPINPLPHIFYNINTDISTKTIGYINGLGVKEELTGRINTPSHSIDFALPTYNLTFGLENNEWNNYSSDGTLFKNYYDNYVSSIFNIKRRNFKYTAILPLRTMLNLKLNDILVISGDNYRIDNYTTNLLTGKVTLNLINAFATKNKQVLTVNEFTATPTELFFGYDAQVKTVTVTNSTSSTYSTAGATWLSISRVGQNVYFSVDENTSPNIREVIASITDTDTATTIEIFVSQYGELMESF